MFNILAPRVAGARLVDGYAGTGAVGIEAMSRGAASVIFVECDRRAAALLEGNLARCGLADGCAIIRAGFLEAARRTLPPASFDLVLLDPPYDEADLPAVVAAAAPLVDGDGLLVLEHARRRPSPDDAGGLIRARVVPSGGSAPSVYPRRPRGA